MINEDAIDVNCVIWVSIYSDYYKIVGMKVNMYVYTHILNTQNNTASLIIQPHVQTGKEKLSQTYLDPNFNFKEMYETQLVYIQAGSLKFSVKALH